MYLKVTYIYFFNVGAFSEIVGAFSENVRAFSENVRAFSKIVGAFSKLVGALFGGDFVAYTSQAH